MSLAVKRGGDCTPGTVIAPGREELDGAKANGRGGDRKAPARSHLIIQGLPRHCGPKAHGHSLSLLSQRISLEHPVVSEHPCGKAGWRLFGVLILFVSAFALQSAAQSRDAAFLPPGGGVRAWTKTGPTRVFTAADLYGRVDGGAELFLEFGFEQLTVQAYVHTGSTPSPEDGIEVEIYRMTDPVAAFGIYLGKCGRETPDSSFQDRHTLNRYQLTFVRERYFVIVSGRGGQEAPRPVLLDFGRNIAARLPPPAPHPPAPAMPKEGMVEGSLRLLRGPVALQPVYTLGDGDVLQLREKRRTAVAARYRDAKGEWTRVLVDYGSPELANRAFAHLRRNLDSYLKVERETATAVVFKDYASKYGLILLENGRIRIDVGLPARPRSAP